MSVTRGPKVTKMWGNLCQELQTSTGDDWRMAAAGSKGRFHNLSTSLSTAYHDSHSSRHLLAPLKVVLAVDSTDSPRLDPAITATFDADIAPLPQDYQRLRPLGRHVERSSARREPCLSTALDHSQQRPRHCPPQKAHRPIRAQAQPHSSKASSRSSAAEAHRHHQTPRRNYC